MKRKVPSILAISAPGPVSPGALDFVLPACQVPSHVRRVKASDTVEIAMRWSHVDYVFRLNDRLGARSEHSPLVCVDPIPLSTTSQGRVVDVAHLVVPESDIRIQQSRSL